jgi:hypothetical protein
MTETPQIQNSAKPIAPLARTTPKAGRRKILKQGAADCGEYRKAARAIA